MKGMIGSYRIEAPIGTGGMGEVFKAFDDRLERWVAIKRIRPGKEDTDENRERFEREARATAKLNHSSIVHVYEMFHDGSGHCIVMEFVEGRTLQSLTTEKPLDPLLAIDLGRQIAEGLAAAHGKKILHRDLKTENIIVTPDKHAKILDFGLAKPLISEELDHSLTGKGQLVGTSRAMSPEYVGGDTVDVRSDLFALGVLLYETVTGHSPFKAQNTLATLKQVIVHQQPPPREVNPDVPQELSDLIDRLLEKAPEDRPQTAMEVAHELARIGGQYSSSTLNRSPSSPSQSFTASEGDWSLSTNIISNPRMRRYWIGLVTLIVATFVGVSAYFLGRREGKNLPVPEPEGKVRIVLADFENLTKDPLLDDSLDIAFRTSLEQSQFIEILSERQIRAALTRMQRDPTTPVTRSLGTEICLREGAQWLVTRSIVKVGSSYSLSAEIIDPEDESSFSTSGDTATEQREILGALQNVVQDLRTNLGESIAAIEKSSLPLDKVTTPDLEALKVYYLGWTAFSRRNYPEAIPLLKKALERDPEFAMAHARLGSAYQSLQQTENAIYHFDQALKYTDRLTRFEENYLKGWVANLRDTPENMILAWRLLANLYPENASGHNNLGNVHWLFYNQFAEAAREFRVAAKFVEPERRLSTFLALGYCEIALGNLDEAYSLFESVQFKEGLADLYIIQSRYADALSMIDQAEDNLEAITLKAQYHLDRGQFTASIPLAREAIKIASKKGDVNITFRNQMVLLSSLRKGLSDGQLVTALEESIGGAESLLSHHQTSAVSTPIPFLATIGKIAARQSLIGQAERIYELIQEKVETSGVEIWLSYLMMLEGEILMAKNQHAAAIRSYEQAKAALESFQIRESLAHAYKESGETEKAIEEYGWLEKRRTVAFSECYLMCSVRPKNILDWNLSLLNLGELYQAAGNREKAESFYRRFRNRWAKSSDTDALRRASFLE